MDSCYGVFIRIQVFLATLHTCGVVTAGFDLGATILGWITVGIFFLIGAVFRWYNYEEDEEEDPDGIGAD